MSNDAALKLALETVQQLTLEAAGEKILTDLLFQIVINGRIDGKAELAKLAGGEMQSEDPSVLKLADIVRQRSQLLLAKL